MTTLANIDPVHAGLPWAGACVLLRLLLKFSNQEEAAKSAIDQVTDLMVHYARVEPIYLQMQPSGVSKHIESAIVFLYALKLELQTVTACYLESMP